MPDVVGTAQVIITPNTSAFASQLASQFNAAGGAIGGSLTGLNQRLGAAATSFNQFGAAATAAGGRLSRSVTLPIALATAAAVKFGTEFDTAIRTAATIGGVDVTLIGKDIAGLEEESAAAASTMATLRDAAIDLGTRGRLGPVAVAEGFTELARAGISAADAVSTATPILNLATAEGISFADASERSINVFAGYGGALADNANLAEELTSRIDVLANASNLSTTSIGELTDAFRFSGPVAAGLGIQFEETAAALAILANAGFKGTLGGTALRGVLTRLAIASGQSAEKLNELGISSEDALEQLTDVELGNVESELRKLGLRGEELRVAMEEGAGGTEAAARALNRLGTSVFDAEGNMIPLNETLSILEENGATTADVMAIFGQRAGPGLAALLQRGGDELKNLTERLEDSSGAAAKLAEGILSGPEGSFLRLKNTLQALAIAVSESGLLSLFGSIAEALTLMVDGLRNVDPGVIRVVTSIALLAASIGPVLLLVGKMSTGLGALAALLQGTSPLLASFAGIGTGLAAVFEALVLRAAALFNPLTALIATLFLIFKNSEELRDSLGRLARALLGFITPAFEGAGIILGYLGDAIFTVTKFLGDLIAIPINAFAAVLEGALEATGDAAEFAGGELEKLADIITEALAPALEVIAPLVDRVSEFVDGFTTRWQNLMDQLTGGETTVFGIAYRLTQLLQLGPEAVLFFFNIGSAIVDAYDAVVNIGVQFGNLFDVLRDGDDVAQGVGETVDSMLGRFSPGVTVIRDFTTNAIALWDALRTGTVDEVIKSLNKFFTVSDDLDALIRVLADNLERLRGFLGRVGDEFEGVGAQIEGFARVAFGQLADAADAAQDALGALLAGDFDTFRARATDALSLVGDAFANVFGQIPILIVNALGGAADVILTSMSNLPIVGGIAKSLEPLASTLTTAFRDAFAGVANLVSGNLEAARQNFGDFVSGIGTALTVDLPNVLNTIGDVLSGPVKDGLSDALTSAVAAIRDLPIIGPIADALQSALELAVDTVAGRFNLFAALFSNNFDAVKTETAGRIGELLTFLGVVWNETLPEVFSDLGDVLGPAFESIRTFWTDNSDVIFDFIGDLITNIGTALVALAGEIGDAFIAGMALLDTFWDDNRDIIIDFAGDFIAGLGDALLAAAGTLATLLVTVLTGAVDAAASVFQGTPLEGIFTGISDAIGPVVSLIEDNLIPILATLAAGLAAFGIGTVIGAGLTAFVGVLGAVLSPIGLLVAAVAALTFGFTKLFTENEGFRDAFEKIPDVVDDIVGAFKDFLLPAIEDLAEGAGPVLQAISDVAREDLLPALKELIPIVSNTAEIVGKVFAGALRTIIEVLDFVNDSGGLTFLTDAIHLFGDVIRETVHIVRGFTDILAGLLSGDWEQVREGIVSVAEGILELFMTVLADIPKAVTSFVVDLGATILGAFDEVPVLGEAFETLKQTLEGVGEILEGVFDILGGIFSLDTDRIKEGISEVAGGLGDIITEALTALPEILGDIISDGLPLIFSGLAGIGELISGYLDDIPFVGEAFETIGQIVTEVSDGLQGIFDIIGGIIDLDPGRIFDGLRDLGGSLLTLVQEALTALPELLIDGFADAWPLLVSAISGAGSILWEGFKGALSFVADSIGEWVTGIADFFNPTSETSIWQRAIRGLTNAGADLWSGLTETFDFVRDRIGEYIGTLADFWNPLSDTSIWQRIIGLAVGAGEILWDGIVTIFDFVRDQLSTFIGTLVEFWNPLAENSVWQRIIRGATEAGTVLWDGLLVAFDFVSTAFGEWIGRLIDGFNPLSENSIWQRAIRIVVGAGEILWTGLLVAFDFVRTSFETYIGVLVDFWNPLAENSIFQRIIRGVTGAGEILWAGISGGFTFISDRVQEVIDGIVGFFDPESENGLVSRITGFADAIVTAFTGVGEDILDGLIAGITGAVDFAGDFVSSIGQAFIDFINVQVIDRINDAIPNSLFGFDIDEDPINHIQLAQGGIFRSATAAIVGEDGDEVVIPLTKTARALELAGASGLTDMIFSAVAAGRIVPEATLGTANALADARSPERVAAAAILTPGSTSSGAVPSALVPVPQAATFGAAGVPSMAGDTFNIYGVSADQVVAKIRAEKEAELRRIRR